MSLLYLRLNLRFDVTRHIFPVRVTFLHLTEQQNKPVCYRNKEIKHQTDIF